MTHNDAYRWGWQDRADGVRFENPPEEVTDTDLLLWNWQQGWLANMELNW